MKRILLALWLLLSIGVESNIYSQKIMVNGQRYSAAYDADATAFFTAAGITDNTQKSAVNTLVVDLKANGLWSIATAIYPIVGGTATTHKYNLKDPRDLDAAFRLTFTGTWTHSSTGMDPNGSAYANTYYVPSTQSGSGLLSMGIYIRENINQTAADIGAYNVTGEKQFAIWSRFSDVFYGLACEDGILANVANTSSTGWFLASRTGASASFVQKNATTTTKTANTGTPTVAVYIGARNQDGSYASPATKQSAFIWLGGTLTTGQAGTLYTLIQNYQTALSRQL